MEKIKSKLSCPKCKSKNLMVSETGTVSLEFIQKDGYLEVEGNICYGSVYKVDAFCSECKHRWKVRKAIQITDLHIKE
jgi:hypothetical protein